MTEYLNLTRPDSRHTGSFEQLVLNFSECFSNKVSPLQETQGELVELLRKHLGSERLFRLKATGSCVPEMAGERLALDSADVGRQSRFYRYRTLRDGLRPTQLLREPLALSTTSEGVPYWCGALTFISGPERLFVKDPVTHHKIDREYFVVQNASAQLLWVYRVVGEQKAWYLHGFFA